MHDYDPEWDYELDKKPAAAVVAAVKGLLNRCEFKFVLKSLGLDKPAVYYVKGLKGDVLARYIDGTRDTPVIVVDAKAITSTSAKYGVVLDDGVESTIMHELGHAYLDSACDEDSKPEDEEEIVEEFARLFWRGFVATAIKHLTSMRQVLQSLHG